MDKWKSIEPGVWKPEVEGDEITGVLVNKEPKDEKKDLSARYYIENNEGMFLVWGTAVIDNRMLHVGIGQKVKITFKGKAKNKKGQDLNLFEVSVAIDEDIKEKDIDKNMSSDEDPVPVEDVL